MLLTSAAVALSLTGTIAIGTAWAVDGRREFMAACAAAKVRKVSIEGEPTASEILTTSYPFIDEDLVDIAREIVEENREALEHLASVSKATEWSKEEFVVDDNIGGLNTLIATSCLDVALRARSGKDWGDRLELWAQVVDRCYEEDVGILMTHTRLVAWKRILLEMAVELLITAEDMEEHREAAERAIGA